jgi:hypothetical protein
LFLLLRRKVIIKSLVYISVKNDFNFEKLTPNINSFIPLLFGLNSKNNIYIDFHQMRHFCYDCKRKTFEKQFQINNGLLVNSSLELSPNRKLWGKSVKKAGEIEPGVKAKDVKLAERLFKEIPDRHKEHFLTVVDNFPHHKYIKRQGYVEFIRGALPHMKDFGVHKDLAAYKALMNVFPKGRYIPHNIFAAGFFHYPLEQRAAVDILCEMEKNGFDSYFINNYFKIFINFNLIKQSLGIMPDKEMESLIISIFSKYSTPWRKCARMTYWMTKFANANPFPLPDELPLDSLELATLAIKRMCVDLQTKISVFSVII